MANKWPGPVTDQVTVADELAFDALPEETRMLAERVVLSRRPNRKAVSDYESGFSDGHSEGRILGQKEAARKIKEALGEEAVAAASPKLVEALAIGEAA